MSVYQEPETIDFGTYLQKQQEDPNAYNDWTYLNNGKFAPADSWAGQNPDVYVDPNEAFSGDQGASETLGRLNRAQWTDWKNRFAPKVQQLAGMATDPSAPQQAAQQASNSMAASFDSAQNAAAQQREAYGLSQNPQQMASQNRAHNINRSAAMASAGNEARISALDRQQSILAGGMGLSNIPDKVMDS